MTILYACGVKKNQKEAGSRYFLSVLVLVFVCSFVLVLLICLRQKKYCNVILLGIPFDALYLSSVIYYV